MIGSLIFSIAVSMESINTALDSHGNGFRANLRFCCFPQMIIAALEAWKEENGSNKSSISKCSGSMFRSLLAGHSLLLSDTLNHMKESAELVFWKNNYMKSDQASPHRGRGRPLSPRDLCCPVSPCPLQGRGVAHQRTQMLLPRTHKAQGHFKHRQAKGSSEKYGQAHWGLRWVSRDSSSRYSLEAAKGKAFKS